MGAGRVLCDDVLRRRMCTCVLSVSSTVGRSVCQSWHYWPFPSFCNDCNFTVFSAHAQCGVAKVNFLERCLLVSLTALKPTKKR